MSHWNDDLKTSMDQFVAHVVLPISAVALLIITAYRWYFGWPD